MKFALGIVATVLLVVLAATNLYGMHSLQILTPESVQQLSSEFDGDRQPISLFSWGSGLHEISSSELAGGYFVQNVRSLHVRGPFNSCMNYSFMNQIDELSEELAGLAGVVEVDSLSFTVREIESILNDRDPGSGVLPDTQFGMVSAVARTSPTMRLANASCADLYIRAFPDPASTLVNQEIANVVDKWRSIFGDSNVSLVGPQASQPRLFVMLRSNEGSVWNETSIAALNQLTIAVDELPYIHRAFVMSVLTPNTKYFGLTPNGPVPRPVVPDDLDIELITSEDIEQIHSRTVSGGHVGRLVAYDEQSFVVHSQFQYAVDRDLNQSVLCELATEIRTGSSDWLDPDRYTLVIELHMDDRYLSESRCRR